MEYRPESTAAVARFALAVVEDVAVVPAARMASVRSLDRRVLLGSARDPVSGAELAVPDLVYASAGYHHFEPGGTYLVAFADDCCVGVFQVAKRLVTLPDGHLVDVGRFCEQYLGRGLPDYFGFRSGFTT